MESGILDDVDIMLGCHTNTDNEAGKMIFRHGAMFAQSDEFDIEIKGKGGHAAYPQLSNDVIIATNMIVTGFQNIISRGINVLEPAVLSICKIKGGEAHNVMPNTIAIGGTLRTLNKETRDSIIKQMDNVLLNISNIYGCDYKFNYTLMCPLVSNNDEIVDRVKAVAENILGSENSIWLKYPDLGGEDFSYYSNKIPSCYFYFGVRNESKKITATYHNSMFDIDEICMKDVQAVLVNSTLDLQEL